MVAGEAKPPLATAALLVGLFAIFHGHAHGTELPAGQSGLAYSIGFVVATGLLHGVGIAIGVVHRWQPGRIALRVAGAAVALAGVAFLWRAVGVTQERTASRLACCARSVLRSCCGRDRPVRTW